MPNKYAIDEAVEDCACSLLDSFRHLVPWLLKHNLPAPGVTVTTDNVFRATWGTGSDHFVGLAFLPDGAIRYVLFEPNPTAHNSVLRRQGRIASDVTSTPAARRAIVTKEK